MTGCVQSAVALSEALQQLAAGMAGEAKGSMSSSAVEYIQAALRWSLFATRQVYATLQSCGTALVGKLRSSSATAGGPAPTLPGLEQVLGSSSSGGDSGDAGSSALEGLAYDAERQVDLALSEGLKAIVQCVGRLAAS